MDLHDELETAIGHGPALPPPEVRLAAGRTALRRRRAVLAAGTAGAVAAIVLPVAVLAGGTSTSGREVPPAVPSPSESSRVGPSQPREGAPVDIDRTTRELVVDQGAVVNARVDDVVPGIVGWSAALDVSQADRRYWVVLAWDETRGDVRYDEAEPGRTGLAEWSETYLPELERLYAPGRAPSQRVPGLAWEGDRFVATGATRVLEQRSPVDLGERFAPDEAVTGAAMVDLDGLRILVLYRQLPGVRGQLVSREDVGDRDLEAALVWASEMYAGVQP